MGMSERDQTRFWRDIGSEKWRAEYKDFNKFLAWLFATTVFIFFVWMLYRALFSVFGAGWGEFEAMTASFRNLGLIFVGVLGFPFAVWRVMIADDQVKVAKKDGADKERERINVETRKENDDRRRDKERVEERLEGAVRLLAEPTDSMKQFAISLLEQIATEHWEQALGSALVCLSGQAKEYSPYFSEQEEATIRNVAERKVVEYLDEEISIWSASFSPGEPRELKPTEERETRKQIELEKNKRGRPRAEEMRRKLVGALNRLALQAGRTDPDTNKRTRDETVAFFDLRGVEISSTFIHSISVNPFRFGGCTFTDVTFHNCTFTGSFEKSTKFLNCIFKDCKFGNFGFPAVNFKGCDFSDSVLYGSTLRKVLWFDCLLGNIEFEDTKISKKLTKMFFNCDMTGINFFFETSQAYDQASKNIDSDFRVNYLPADFEGNYIQKNGAPPFGLNMVAPLIEVTLRQDSDDGKLQYFSVEPVAESP